MGMHMLGRVKEIQKPAVNDISIVCVVIVVDFSVSAWTTEGSWSLIAIIANVVIGSLVLRLLLRSGVRLIADNLHRGEN